MIIGAQICVESFEEEFAFAGKDICKAFRPAIHISGMVLLGPPMSQEDAQQKVREIATELGVKA